MFGTYIEVTHRGCMPDANYTAGQCMEKEVPDFPGKHVIAEVCSCKTDLCNSVPIVSQTSVFNAFFLATISVIHISW